MSSPGLGALLGGELVGVGVQLDRGLDAGLVGRSRTRGRRRRSCGSIHSNSLWRSSWGTPMISAMACSGSSAAMSTTKSHSPRSMTLSTIVVDAARSVLVEQPDHARREALVDEQPVARVLRRVHVEHHQALCRRGPPRTWSMVSTPPCSTRTSSASRFTVTMSSCRTTVQKTGAVGVRVPVDGGLAPQRGEHLVRHPGHEVVRIVDVDVAEFHGFPRDRARRQLPRTMRTCSSQEYPPSGSGADEATRTGSVSRP